MSDGLTAAELARRIGEGADRIDTGVKRYVILAPDVDPQTS